MEFQNNFGVNIVIGTIMTKRSYETPLLTKREKLERIAAEPIGSRLPPDN